MANKNNFKAFALDPNANVMSQADWEALPALLSGFTAGKASSAQVNKALRQGTVMASVIAQFITDTTGLDVLDNGDLVVLQQAFAKAMRGRLLNVQTFTSSGSYLPTQGTTKIIVECLGGGGGGGGAQAGNGFASFGGGGGAASFAKGMFTNLLASYSVTIGAGGTGGGGTSNGTTGGTSSLGSLISASGGNPGQTVAAGTDPYILGSQGIEGVITGGNIISCTAKNTGGNGYRLSNTVCSGGNGADSQYGHGGDAANSTNRAGGNASGYGAGGAGGRAINASGTPFIGGNGSSGIIIVSEYS